MHILVAVDGTLSATHYNVGTNRSYTRQCYDRFGGRGAFFEGPTCIIGTDVDNIERAAWS